jgi:hypothetical protein
MKLSPLPLPYAVDLLLTPLTSRFNFHYMRDQSTNRLDKPEWAFSFAATVLTSPTHGALLALLEKSHYRGVDIAFTLLNKFPAFISTLTSPQPLSSTFRKNFLSKTVVPRTRKLITYFKQLHESRENSNSYLSDCLLHFLQHLILFEKSTSHLLSYSQSDPISNQSVISCFATNSDMFSLWISVDKQHVNKELEKLRALSRPWEILSASSRSCSEFLRLFDAISDRYRYFPNNWIQASALQLRYFSEVQRPLLELYLEDIELAARASLNTAKSFWKQGIAALGSVALSGLASKLFSFGRSSKIPSSYRESELFPSDASTLKPGTTYEGAFAELIGQVRTLHFLVHKLTQSGCADPLFIRLVAARNGAVAARDGAVAASAHSNLNTDSNQSFFAAEVTIIETLAFQVI